MSASFVSAPTRLLPEPEGEVCRLCRRLHRSPVVFGLARGGSAVSFRRRRPKPLVANSVTLSQFCASTVPSSSVTNADVVSEMASNKWDGQDRILLLVPADWRGLPGEPVEVSLSSPVRRGAAAASTVADGHAPLPCPGSS